MGVERDDEGRASLGSTDYNYTRAETDEAVTKKPQNA